MEQTKTCETCGLPSWAVTGEGVVVQIEEKAANNFQRSHRRTVWCCSESCTVQALAISKYGPNSSTWPITLAQFKAMEKDHLQCPAPRIASRRSTELAEADHNHRLDSLC